jgi:hypothetical protein
MCIIAELYADPGVENSLNRPSINLLLFETVQSKLGTLQISLPVEYGRECFGHTADRQRQLSLRFYVAVTTFPDLAEKVILSITVNSYYEGSVGPPHEFPTRVATCPRNGELSKCISSSVMSYFEETAFETIKRAKQR